MGNQNQKERRKLYTIAKWTWRCLHPEEIDQPWWCHPKNRHKAIAEIRAIVQDLPNIDREFIERFQGDRRVLNKLQKLLVTGSEREFTAEDRKEFGFAIESARLRHAWRRFLATESEPYVASENA